MYCILSLQLAILAVCDAANRRLRFRENNKKEIPDP